VLKTYTTAELLLPNKFLENFVNEPFPKIRTTIALEDIDEVRIVPKGSCFVVEIAYLPPKKEKVALDPTSVANIDLNVNNLLVITSNIFIDGWKLPPVLIRGYYAKWANQLMNKKIGDLQSARTQGTTISKGLALPETLEMKRIRQNRQNRVRNYFHYCSCFSIEFCKKFGIGKLIVGHNNYWKSEINLGKQINQNFAYLPFSWLIDQIKYKGKMAGIEVLVETEGYTSKASAIDGDFIPDYDPEHPYEGTFSGYRSPSMKGKKSRKKVEAEMARGKKNVNKNARYNPRGLYYSKKSENYIHADVDGSYNIGRKHAPNAFNKITVKDMLVAPVVVNLLKYSSQYELQRLIERVKSGSIAEA
jgi:IS605 OrfB family transposase